MENNNNPPNPPLKYIICEMCGCKIDISQTKRLENGKLEVVCMICSYTYTKDS